MNPAFWGLTVEWSSCFQHGGCSGSKNFSWWPSSQKLPLNSLTSLKLNSLTAKAPCKLMVGRRFFPFWGMVGQFFRNLSLLNCWRGERQLFWTPNFPGATRWLCQIAAPSIWGWLYAKVRRHTAACYLTRECWEQFLAGYRMVTESFNGQNCGSPNSTPTLTETTKNSELCAPDKSREQLRYEN